MENPPWFHGAWLWLFVALGVVVSSEVILFKVKKSKRAKNHRIDYIPATSWLASSDLYFMYFFWSRCYKMILYLIYSYLYTLHIHIRINYIRSIFTNISEIGSTNPLLHSTTRVELIRTVDLKKIRVFPVWWGCTLKHDPSYYSQLNLIWPGKERHSDSYGHFNSKPLWISEWVNLVVKQKPVQKRYSLVNTVDGRNPAPVDMENIPLFAGFYTSQVVVWDFWTINSMSPG